MSLNNLLKQIGKYVYKMYAPMRDVHWLNDVHILHKFYADIMVRKMFIELSVIDIFISSQRHQRM